MALRAPIEQYTVEEYLALERAAEVKSEYIGGQIVVMTGASRAHNLICLNLGGEVNRQLRGRPCESYVNDMRVKAAGADLYTYPDVIVVCGEPRFEDGHLDTLLNPTVIVEILSPSTEAYDRGEKFARYRHIDTLREYVLVSQDRPRIEHFLRHDQVWEFSAVDGLDATVSFPSVDVSIPLRDIYDRVEFETPPS